MIWMEFGWSGVEMGNGKFNFDNNLYKGSMQNNSVEKNLKDFEALLEKCTLHLKLDKNNPEALSQLYKMMNYKPTSNKGEKLSTEQVANFLKVNKKN